jgi:PiT family inorganic phosphate transporter
METVLMVGVIVAVIAFNVTGAFHDAAEITAPGVVTQAVRPAVALGLFAAMAFAGPFLAGTAVADAIAGFVDLGGLEPRDALLIVLAGVAGAALWNLVTWKLSIPSSSTHGLTGGVVGVTVVAADPDAVVWGIGALADGRLEGVMKIVIALLVSPVIGVVFGAAVLRLGRVAMGRATRAAHRRLRRTQLAGTGLLAFAHGANDAQKGIGIIALALVLGGELPEFSVPAWAVALSAATIVLGGLMGGWGIARTLGFGIYRLEPLHGASAQASAAAIIYGAAIVGGPVSTTQVVGSTITGVGVGDRARSVRWDTAKSMAIVWLVTVPAAAAAAVIVYAALWAALLAVG